MQTSTSSFSRKKFCEHIVSWLAALVLSSLSLECFENYWGSALKNLSFLLPLYQFLPQVLLLLQLFFSSLTADGRLQPA